VLRRRRASNRVYLKRFLEFIRGVGLLMRVLLVDHDSEGLEAIARAIRGVLEIDCVTSKGDALLLLRQNTYDVLIACERAIDGSGLDLLGRTTRTAVPIKRIFAAAPERLQLLGPRLAPFKVQRTINYPIDLEELWLAIAQVTGGPDDETDGTIERVVLDERGIPSTGTTPRGPIPPRPPAPLGHIPQVAIQQTAASQAPVPAIAAVANGAARAAAVQLTQPAPEPPLRAPPPPRAVPPMVARAPAAPAPMRAQPAPIQSIPAVPMPAASTTGSREILPGWVAEPAPEDDFAQVAAQARIGVQQKVVDEASRRKQRRLLTACGIAVAVAGALVFLIERFYDPAAIAREQAIAAEVTRMSEQQKVTDNLTLIEIDIENAIMKNDFDTARAELASLIEKSPNHPRREFLQASIDRAAELARLAPQNSSTAAAQGASSPAVQAQVLPPPVSIERAPDSRTRPAERAAERTPDRVASRNPERAVPRTVQPSSLSANGTRSYGAPISEPPRQAAIPLNAPINSEPVLTAPRSDNAFRGRTVEASDASVTRAPVAPPPARMAPNTAVQNPAPQAAGSAVVIAPPVAPPAQESAPAVDVVPAKLVRRVTPMAPLDTPKSAKGYVIVRFTVSEKGRVSNIEVIESTPQGLFEGAAQDAVKKWIYEPRKENGVAVPSTGQARLVFEEAN
jgi:TonB family protein